MVGALLADLARRWDIPVVRLPWSQARTPLAMGVRRFARTLRRNLDEQGRCYTDRYFGIDQAGQMDAPALAGIVQGLREICAASVDPIAEIAVHPGEAHDPELGRYPWPGSARDVELEALTSSAVREAFAMAGHELVTPAALLNRREHVPPARGAAPPPPPARRSPPRP
jgi:hypothetical protein